MLLASVKLGSLSTGHLIQNSAPSQTTTKLSTIKGFSAQEGAEIRQVQGMLMLDSSLVLGTYL